MVQIIPKNDFGSALGQAIGGGLQQGFQGGLERQYAEMQKQQKTASLGKALEEAEKIYADNTLSPEQKQVGLFKALKGHPEMAVELGKQLPMVTKAAQPKPPKQAPFSERQVPPEISTAIQNIVSQNPQASADELLIKMDEAGIPRGYSNQFSENRRREQDAAAKAASKLSSERAKETLPYRKEIAEKGSAARTGIENKEHLLEIIDRGNLDDPTYAAVAEALPFNLGKRLLSNDTVEYKSGLIDEYKDLRNIFKGATRVKEIDLLEEKTADIYLTDEQKKAILKSRVNALNTDVMKADISAQVEKDLPNAGIGEFVREVEKRFKEENNKLASQVIDEQKKIIAEAEKMKDHKLDLSNPEDEQIIRQILKEANNDYKKAEALAKKKGYKF